jgi:8-oxo-(d)GTP phosphatase
VSNSRPVNDVRTASPQRRARRPRPRKTICAGCVVYREASGEVVVLVARRANGTWGLPKGKVTSGESLRSAAAREVLEETGCTVAPSQELGATVYPFGPASFKHVSWFAAKFLGGETTPDGREFVELRWVTLQAATSMLIPSLAGVVSTFSQMHRAGLL